MNEFFDDLLILVMIASGVAIIPLCFFALDLALVSFFLCIGCVAILNYKDQL